jgi:hypothetical protein
MAMNWHILSDALWMILIFSWGMWDASRNNRKKPIFLHNHLGAWILRAMCAWAIIQFIWFWPGIHYEELAEWFFNLCRYCAWGWPLFDLGYNMVRKGVGLTHVGTTALPDKVFHDIWPENPFIAQLIAKIFFIGITTAIVWIYWGMY